MIKSLKFSHKILLAAALVVIATFSLFTLYNDSLQRTSIREDLEDYLHEMGEITASNVQNWLSGRILLIENLAQTLARDHSPETTQALLEQPLLGSTFLFTYLGQTDGTYTARPTSDLPADYDPRRRPWYNAATSAGQTTLTEPYMEPAIHELVLTIASPARQDGQPFGVVGGDLSLQTVVKIINSLDFGGMGYAFLVSGDGKILVHPDKDQVMKSLSDVYPRNTPKIGSGFSEAELHGNTRILSFSPVKGLSGLDWYIGISVDKDKAYAMLTKLRTSAIVAALIAVVAIVLLLGMLIRVLMQPLTDMGRAMQDIAQGEGDLTKRLKVTSNDEFGVLAISFNRFVERIHESIREVAGTARQLHDVAQLVVNASNSSMANSDEQSNRTNSVAAAINELGAAAQEIARNAADASHHASDANHQAEDGKQVVEQTIRAMNELSEKISASCANIEALNSRTVNIGQILEVIKGISEHQRLLRQHRGPQQPHGEHRPDPRSDQGHLRADQPARPQRRHRSRPRRRGRTRLRGGRRRGAQPGPPRPGVGPADPEDDRGTADRRPGSGQHHDRESALQPGERGDRQPCRRTPEQCHRTDRRDRRDEPVGGHRHRGADRGGRFAEHGHHRDQHPQPGRRGEPPGHPARLRRAGNPGRAPAPAGGQLQDLSTARAVAEPADNRAAAIRPAPGHS